MRHMADKTGSFSLWVSSRFYISLTVARELNSRRPMKVNPFFSYLLWKHIFLSSWVFRGFTLIEIKKIGKYENGKISFRSIMQCFYHFDVNLWVEKLFFWSCVEFEWSEFFAEFKMKTIEKFMKNTRFQKKNLFFIFNSSMQNYKSQLKTSQLSENVIQPLSIFLQSSNRNLDFFSLLEWSWNQLEWSFNMQVIQ